MLKLLATLLVFYIAIVVLMFGLQRVLMYMPDKNLGPPEAYGLAGMQVVEIKTSDHLTLTAWYAPAASDRPTILYLHGNGGHLGYRAAFNQEAMQRGFGMLALSYRGYGTSEGTPNEEGLYADAKAALQFLQEEKQLQREEILLFGESIGAAVAIEVARRQNFKALVLQAPFTSMVARASAFYPWLPVRWILRDRYMSIEKVKDITMPVLILVAERDTIVPANESELVYNAIAGQKARRLYVGIGHNDFEAQAVLDELELFLGRINN